MVLPFCGRVSGDVNKHRLRSTDVEAKPGIQRQHAILRQQHAISRAL